MDDRYTLSEAVETLQGMLAAKLGTPTDDGPLMQIRSDRVELIDNDGVIITDEHAIDAVELLQT